MTDTNTVYSDVTFVKTRKGTRGESLQITFISLLLNNIIHTFPPTIESWVTFAFVITLTVAETTSTPDETTYSEVKVSKIKAPSEPDGKCKKKDQKY